MGEQKVGLAISKYAAVDTKFVVKPFPGWAIALIVIACLIVFGVIGYYAYRHWKNKRGPINRGGTRVGTNPNYVPLPSVN